MERETEREREAVENEDVRAPYLPFSFDSLFLSLSLSFPEYPRHERLSDKEEEEEVVERISLHLLNVVVLVEAEYTRFSLFLVVVVLILSLSFSCLAASTWSLFQNALTTTTTEPPR